jgi:uncharacterized protein (DUF58 family)
MRTTEEWRPTPAHVRAVVGGLAGAASAILMRRPDLLVLAAPLVCAAVWGALRRPVLPPRVTEIVGQTTLREGQVTRRIVHVEDATGRVDDVAVVFDPPTRIDQAEKGRLVAGLAEDGDETLHVVIRPTRWGRHRLPPPLIVASSAWNAYRYVWRNSRQLREILALPEPALFDAVAPAVHAPGLIGVNRSPLQGSGAEFATIRPFQPGDRLRRIHWPASLRTDRLHVATTFADHDRHVALLVDAFDDVGSSGGIFGSTSSLDIELRATASIAEHYIRSGDRVSMVTMGSLRFRRIPPGVGRRHLRRLLELLARTEPSRVLDDDGRVPRGLGSGALVMLVSPLLSVGALQRLVAIADLGLDVVAIDCLPVEIHKQFNDPHVQLTWRIGLLERERRLRQVREAGIPVVQWRGPGSLDPVLRVLYRRANVRAGGR